MSQIELAAKSKLTQATISRLERGDLKSVNSEALGKIASALDVSSDFLLGVTQSLTVKHSKISQAELDALVKGYQELNPQLRKNVFQFFEYAKSPFGAFVIESGTKKPYTYRRVPYLGRDNPEAKKKWRKKGKKVG